MAGCFLFNYKFFFGLMIKFFWNELHNLAKAIVASAGWRIISISFYHPLREFKLHWQNQCSLLYFLLRV